jgi:hypothetical protein
MSKTNYSFDGWNVTKWILGAKRAVIAIIAILITKGTEMSPDVAFIVATTGITADRLFAIIEYYIKKQSK